MSRRRQQPDGCSGKAVVVNDDLSVLETTALVLRHQGYETITALNGLEALSIYDQNKDSVCIVLLDLLIPVMGGKETIKAIRQIDPSQDNSNNRSCREKTL